ncbi:hypothetical protein GCM10007382_15760 [Salinibacterium xinjiangense]|uniref:Uncharacterized protein n=1 Tax=Salinibacterium xinjiangense TaxID=386302 RepID=A0A2C8YBF7_9MICO|nr:hypothetical protein [Salinibacterium xinjiangense]GGK96335.1 hypothetical protein GCM10007382_15760 [Salinibacterium xinjiangense]SOE47562.1 hypothetical protein SAMN06296378_0225 [Salinibacterium xinjiangense]
MLRIALSVVIALVASVLGYAALWQGGFVLMREAVQFDRTTDPTALPFVVGGLVLLVVAMLSVAMSSVGVITVGVVHLLSGLVAVLDPSLTFIRLIAQSFGEGSTIGDGVLYSVSTGIGMLAGVVFLVTGLAALTRRSQRPGAVARVASVIVAIVAGPMGVLLAFMGGGLVYTDLIVLATGGFNPTGAVLLLVGTVLLGLAVLTLRWSSVGLMVLGSAIAAIGFFGLVGPGQLASIAERVSRELSVTVQFAAPNGNLALLGMLLLAAALGTVLRSRRRR